MAKIDAIRPSDATAAAAAGFGVAAVLAPRSLSSVYGLPGTPPFRTLMRMWGSRTAALAAAVFTAGDERVRRQALAAGAAVSALDTVTTVAGGRDLPGRTRLMLVGTSAAFAAALAAAAAGLIE